MVLQWYREKGRHHLPWRQTTDPYRIYLSEVMLQQTPVERVIPYYQRFLDRFPTLEALGEGEEEEVLALWSGLGYYSRARNLHRTARISGGELPRSYRELLQLPGIGRYTASAISSFAYGEARAVVDTNIKRVLKRYWATSDGREIWELAERLLDRENPREHNLALMDLGALICRPKDPLCSLCPLRSRCLGRGDPLAYSSPSGRSYSKVELHLGISLREGSIALVPSQGRLYRGMLLLPSVPGGERAVATIYHTYSRYRVRVLLYPLSSPPADALWVPLSRLGEVPVPSLVRKAVKAYLEGGD
ncbi:MAG: A/G-specific adenine glycosylase [Epsilonproteobacteria bacterium]|nr:A/G-specific adenine glycosylase [Campylobacterota bacterium]